MKYKSVTKHKVGDMVKIKENPYFKPEIKEWISNRIDNRITEVTKIKGFLYFVDGIDLWFTDDMLEPSKKDWASVDDRWEILDI